MQTPIRSPLIHNFGFSLALGLLCALKCLYAYFIPLNLIPYLIHDDFLFYRLASHLAELKWLGPYEATTLIKGFVYPGFISISLYTHLPIRILEAALVCLSSYYFLRSMQTFWNKTLLVLLFATLLFYPLQYGATEFRLVRDTIYPQLMLLLVTSLFFIYLQPKIQFNWRKSFHAAVFALALFLFLNTREEGIWILPALGFLLLFIVVRYYQQKNLISLLKCTIVASVVFAVLHLGLLATNARAYHSAVTTIFQDKAFKHAYPALQRASSARLPLDGMANRDWEKLYLVSPAALELKPYLESKHYANWAKVGCAAIRSLGQDMSQSNCDQAVPVGHFMYAFLDAIASAGYKSLPEVLGFLNRLSGQINQACDQARIICKSYNTSTIDFALLKEPGAMGSIAHLIKQALMITVSYQNPTLAQITPTLEGWEPYYEMKKRLRAFGFDSPFKNLQLHSEQLTLSAYPLAMGGSGVVDRISYVNGILTVGGWAMTQSNQPFSQIEVELNGRPLCTVSPDGFRPDMAHLSTQNLGFLCSAVAAITPQKPVVLRAYGVDPNTRTKFLLSLSDAVRASLTNEWNEACYLEANPAIKEAVVAGRMTALMHWNTFGVHEERPCAPLFNPLYSPQKTYWNARVSILANSLLETLFFWNSKLYHYFNLLFVLVIPLSFGLLYKQKNSALLLLSSTLALLFFTRIVVISILDYLGLAPIWPIYLMSAFYAYFILGCVALVHLLSWLPNYWQQLQGRRSI